MKTFEDISMYNGKEGAACVVGVGNFALDVSLSPEYRQGDVWIQQQCGQVIGDDTTLLDHFSTFRIVGKLAPAVSKNHL